MIDTIATAIPIQFLTKSFSLNKSKPTSVESITIATLLTVNIVELSKFSTFKAFNTV